MNIPIQEIKKGQIYSVIGPHAEKMMDKLIFLFEDEVKKGFVE